MLEGIPLMVVSPLLPCLCRLERLFSPILSAAVDLVGGRRKEGGLLQVGPQFIA